MSLARLTLLTQVKVVTHTALVSDTPHWHYLAAVTGHTFMDNHLLLFTLGLEVLAHHSLELLGGEGLDLFLHHLGELLDEGGVELACAIAATAGETFLVDLSTFTGVALH